MTDKSPSPGRLYDSIMRVRSKRHLACDEAVQRVHERFSVQEAKLFKTADEATRAKVVAMLEADDEPAMTVAAGLDNFRAHCADIGRAMTAMTGAPGDNQADPSPAPPDSDIPPALREPLPEARLKIGQRR